MSGNSRMVLIANISLCSIDLNETISTLQFASRAMTIHNYNRKNIINVNLNPTNHLSKYDETISQLQNEVKQLRNQLSSNTHNQHLISNYNIYQYLYYIQSLIHKLEIFNLSIYIYV